MTHVMWILVILSLVVIELLTSALVAIWAIPGAILGWVAYLLGANTMTQFILAAIVSLIGMGFAMKLFLARKNTTAPEVGSMLGEMVVVGETVSKNNSGTARYRDVTWTAVVEKNVTLDPGARAKVVRVDGNKLILETVEEDK